MADGRELARLRAENEQLKGELVAARQVIAERQRQITVLRQEITVLQQRIAELEHGPDNRPPSFVKPNRRKVVRSPKPRKRRDAKHNHARRRDTATRSVQHAYDRCPECHYKLQGTSVDYTRQVIELPPPQPVEVTEHQVIRRYCPRCQRFQSPKLDLRGEVLGQSRMGVRLVSLVAYLRTSLRLPVRSIQVYLQTMHNLTISVGEIVGLLDQVREATKGAVEELKGEARQSSVVHADETGWRQDGQNGYVWSFSTVGDKAVRYYEFDASRSQSVVRRILGNQFHGHLVSDFYCGYNDYECEKQRCWVHLLRDLEGLKEKFSQVGEALE